MRQRSPKDAVEFVLCWHLCWAWSLHLRVVCFLSESPLGKTSSSFAGLSIGDISGFEMGACPCLISALEPHLVQSCAQGSKPANHSKANGHNEVTEAVTEQTLVCKAIF